MIFSNKSTLGILIFVSEKSEWGRGKNLVQSYLVEGIGFHSKKHKSIFSPTPYSEAITKMLSSR